MLKLRQRVKNGETYFQALKYFISGGSAFAVYFLLLTFLTEVFQIYHLTSLGIAYFLSIFVNFFISKYFVFVEKKNKSSMQILKFFCIAFLGLFLQFFITYFFTKFVDANYLIANVIASGFIFLVSFSLNKYFTFSIVDGKN